MMDDRTDPEPPLQAGFRTYSDDTLRLDRADDFHATETAPGVNDPWGRGLRIRYAEAPVSERMVEAGSVANAGPMYVEPGVDAERPRRRGVSALLAAGAMVCAAALVGFLLGRGHLRAPAEYPAARTASAAPSLAVEVAQADPPRPAAQNLATSPSDAPPRGVRLEVLRPAPSTSPPAPSSPANTEPSRAEPVPISQAPAPAPARFGVAAPAPFVAPALAPAPARREVAPAPVEGVPVRVFVHIADDDQLPTADRIRADLNGLRFADRPVATPPVRFVADSPGRTEIRCLKHADCPAASRVARYLAQTLGEPVFVVDMSPTYEGDRSVRAGSLELWLGP